VTLERALLGAGSLRYPASDVELYAKVGDGMKE